MVLSTRVSLQWIPQEPEELTNTLVFTSAMDHFVDVRIYKHRYPYNQTGPIPDRFEDVFQWVIVGEEEEIENSNQIRFNHTVNSQEVLKSLASGKHIEECRNNPDIGTFWPIEGSEDRKETGAMVHPETGVSTEYVEIWRSLNPNATTIDHEVRENYDQLGRAVQESADPVMTYDLNIAGFIGRIVRLGNWVQGVIYEEAERQFPLSVMRRSRDPESGVWTSHITYGKHDFPAIYEEDETKSPDGSWERVE